MGSWTEARRWRVARDWTRLFTHREFRVLRVVSHVTSRIPVMGQLNHFRAIVLVVLGSLLGGAMPLANSAEPAGKGSQRPPPADPMDQWGVELHTSALMKIGDSATPLDYTFLAQMLIFKSPQHFHRKLGSGDFFYRVRTTLLLEPIVRGPESYFVGVAFSPSLEWRSAARDFTGFFSAGGGVGWMDARGHQIAGAQGQDFNLNWFIHSGGSYHWSPQLSGSLGVYFQHLSNGGMNKINPGVNALGPTLGLVWKF